MLAIDELINQGMEMMQQEKYRAAAVFLDSI